MSFANFVLGLMVTITAILAIKAAIFVYSVCAYKSKASKSRKAGTNNLDASSHKTHGTVTVSDRTPVSAPFSDNGFSFNERLSHSGRGQGHLYVRNSSVMILPSDQPQRLSEIKLHDGQLILVFEGNDMQIKSTCPEFPPPPYSTELL